jgi:hypothetical protein
VISKLSVFGSIVGMLPAVDSPPQVIISIKITITVKIFVRLYIFFLKGEEPIEVSKT